MEIQSPGRRIAGPELIDTERKTELLLRAIRASLAPNPLVSRSGGTNVRQTTNLILFAVTLAISAAMVLGGTTPALAQNPPFMVTSPLNSAVPFNVTMPSTTPNGTPLKTVVIDFVTADCDTSAGITTVGSAQVTVLFSGQNGFYHLAFGPPQSFASATEFVITQPTLMFADPGSTVNFGISGGMPTCTVVFSGHLIPK